VDRIELEELIYLLDEFAHDDGASLGTSEEEIGDDIAEKLDLLDQILYFSGAEGLVGPFHFFEKKFSEAVVEHSLLINGGVYIGQCLFHR